VLNGDPPSPLEPPSGCVFRTRCPLAIGLCPHEVTPLEQSAPGREVACHSWREV
jgi:oligopeptide/dipeptide ABC transporter ATP-binding protein